MAHSETMTSRQRVLTALNHQVPDRVPIDFGGFQTGIHQIAYRQLLDYLGMTDEITLLDPVQQLAVPGEEVLRRFHVDTRYVCAHGPDSFSGDIETNERDGRIWHDLRDEFGVVWSLPEDGFYMDITHHPLADADINDIESYPFPDGGDVTRFTGVREQAETVLNETPYALSTGISGVVYETCWYMRGLEQWFMDLVTRPEFCEALLDKTLAYWLDYFTVFMREAGGLFDVIMIGDDLAAQSGPLFSPDIYRAIVKPRQKKLVQHIRSLSNSKIWYHTCGAVKEYIPELLDNGIDIINPVQIGLPGMEPLELKRAFGDRIVFWGGGIDAQHILPFGSPEDVRKAVKQNVGIFKQGGGYVFNNVHNIQAGVPPENIVALFDAAYEYGWYD